MSKHHSVIIDIKCEKDGNFIAFSVHGSLQWMEEIELFINYNVAFSVGILNRENIEEDSDQVINTRKELKAAYEAMQRRESYQGNIVSLTILEK